MTRTFTSAPKSQTTKTAKYEKIVIKDEKQRQTAQYLDLNSISFMMNVAPTSTEKKTDFDDFVLIKNDSTNETKSDNADSWFGYFRSTLRL